MRRAGADLAYVNAIAVHAVAISQRRSAIYICADKISLDQIVRCAGIFDFNAEDGVSGNDVSRRCRCSADQVIRGAIYQNAKPIYDRARSGRIGTDEVSLHLTAVPASDVYTDPAREARRVVPRNNVACSRRGAADR